MGIVTNLVRSALLIALAISPAWADGVRLTQDDLVLVLPSVWAAPDLVLPEVDPELPILGAEAKQDGTRLLRILNGSEDINGFDGILYDNRDRDHSTLDAAVFPRLSRLEYGPELVSKGLDYGLAGRVILPTVVLGNSSTAMTSGDLQRSLPRLAMTQSGWRTVTPMLYANNQIYVYPEHRDYDGDDRYPI
ncbi:MAG: hypothetical protein AAF674_22645, partial [Pseudomonadota bacterium]